MRNGFFSKIFLQFFLHIYFLWAARHHVISRYRDTMMLYSYKTVQLISRVAISPLALTRSHQISCVCHSLDSCDVVLNSSFGIWHLRASDLWCLGRRIDMHRCSWRPAQLTLPLTDSRAAEIRQLPCLQGLNENSIVPFCPQSDAYFLCLPSPTLPQCSPV